ncbi:MAG TPA: nucleotidyltransferase domain-containing protein [Acetobacteraceae bacterium]|nr:nucleotidyltransferase domain-containing protein [Acetobacteraceae bacterium]
MTRDIIIETLKTREPELRRLGVRHIALFGSAARGEVIDASDIDILVDLRPDAPIGVFEYVGLTQFVEDLFPVPVDVANHARLKSHVRPSAEREAVYAF